MVANLHDDAHESVLKHVIGQVAVAHDRIDVGVNGRLVAIQQNVECLIITFFIELDEHGVSLLFQVLHYFPNRMVRSNVSVDRQ